MFVLPQMHMLKCNPSIRVLGSEVFSRSLDHEGGALMDVISTPIKMTPGGAPLLLPPRRREEKHREVSICEPQRSPH